MDSKKASSLTKMDKIRIVVEYSELSEHQRVDYLKENGIDQKTLMEYQKEAASVIGIEPPKPKTPCEELIEELQEKDENRRREAARKLGAMRFKASSAVNVLIDRMLNDPIDFVRSWSAWALTRIEPRNPDVITGFLEGLTKDEDSLNTRNWCVAGLSVSEDDKVKKHVLEILYTGKPFVQFAAIEVLSRLRVTSPKFVAGLKLALKSDNESLRELAQTKLSKIQAED